MKHIFVTGVLSLCLTGIAGATQPSFPNLNALIQQGDIRDHQLIVKYKNPTSVLDWSSILQTYSVDSVKDLYRPSLYLQHLRPELAKWQLVTFKPTVDLADQYQALKHHAEVEYVVPNYRFTKNTLPNDLNADLWALKNTGQSDGTVGADIDAEAGWSINHDASNVIVAVIDTGIDYNHPELKNNLWTNPGEIAGNGIDDDGNGYIDDVHGYDFADNDATPLDVDGHGTHVSGTIAAEGNNGAGITGVAWRTKLMAIKIFSDGSDSAYTSDIMNGIMYAADMGAQVSNNSYSASFSDATVAEIYDRPIIEAINYANQAGMLFVAAAGNGYENLDDNMHVTLPAGVELPNVISVAATDHNDALASFSNRGITGADLAAPGVSIYSTIPNNGYAKYSGTSMAAPHVTGAAALALAMQNDLAPAELRSLLMSSTETLSQLGAIVLSGGRLNLAKLLQPFASTGGDCPSFTTTVINHYSAGRAKYCPGSYLNMCAVGSGETLGLSYSNTQITLYQIDQGFYSTIDSCTTGEAFTYPPVMQISDPAEIFVLAGSEYALPRVTAYDREDGDMSHLVVHSPLPDTNQPGRYLVRFDVIDSDGNSAAPLLQIVNVLAEDLPPRISLLGTQCLLPLICNYEKLAIGTSWQDPGYVAWDLFDGDLTEQVQVSALNPNQLGLQVVNYTVSDSVGNPWTDQDTNFRIVLFLDQDLPRVEFYHPETFRLDVERDHIVTYRRDGESFNPRYGVYDLNTDDYDAFTINESHNVDLSITGNYQLSVTATDPEGHSDNRTQTIEVVEDVTPPVVSLIGSTYLNVEIGSDGFYDPGTETTDDLDWSVYAIRNDDHFDINREGTYTLQYSATDGAGNTSLPVNRQVTVVRSHWNHPPRFTYTSSPTSEQQITIKGHVFDIDDDVDRVELQFDDSGLWIDAGTLTPIGDHKVSFAFVYDELGKHSVTYRAIDRNGNESDYYHGIFTVKATLIPPRIENIGISVNGYRVTITGTVVDDDNNAAGVVGWGAFDLTCTSVTEFTCTGSAPDADTYGVNIRAYDEDGNYGPIETVIVTTQVSCIKAKNSVHISEGRAEQCGGSLWSPEACAVGSGDALGSASTWFGATTSLQETSPDYWKKVSTCP